MLNNVKIIISLTSLIFSSLIFSQSLPFEQLQQLEALQQSMQSGSSQDSDSPVNNIQPLSENNSLNDDIEIQDKDDLEAFFMFNEQDDFKFAPQPKISDQEIKYFGYDFFDNVPFTFSALEDIPVPQDYILGPILGIDDPRTNSRIDFVGGSRGVKELISRVDSGENKIAFALFPTSMEDLMSVADSGLLMPPKSTWFEPKLADGLLSHTFF